MEILVWESFETAAAIRRHPGPAAHSYNLGMKPNLIYHPLSPTPKP